MVLLQVTAQHTKVFQLPGCPASRGKRVQAAIALVFQMMLLTANYVAPVSCNDSTRPVICRAISIAL